MQTQGVALKNVKKPSSKNVANNPIREYIFHPHQKVKDLRTNVETTDIEEVMKGNLDLFTKAVEHLSQTNTLIVGCATATRNYQNKTK